MHDLKIAVSPPLRGRKAPRRHRGWREIEAMRERAELKKLLAEAWDDDIELEDDIFGDAGQPDLYYVRYSDQDEEDFEEADEFDDILEEEPDDEEL